MRDIRHPSISPGRHGRRHAIACAALLLFAMTAMPTLVRATCTSHNGKLQPQFITFNAGPITLTTGQQPDYNTPILTASSSASGQPLLLDCTGTTNSGISNSMAGMPTGSDDTLFPTGIPGISYRIVRTDTGKGVRAYPNELIDSGFFDPSQSHATSKLQLFYTGPYPPPNNSTLSGEIARWEIDVCNGSINSSGGCDGTTSPKAFEIFQFDATINIVVNTCNVDAGSVNTTVELPYIVANTQLTGTGTTAGKTQFTLQLENCKSGLGISITLDTNNRASAPGVIAPTQAAGYATGVGVQILAADGTTPVTFGTPLNTGTTTGSGYAIDLFARYYQTDATVTAGNVKAVATYTIEYQ